MKPKTKGFMLQLASRKGNDGYNYLFIKAPHGSYHAFVEVETKEALADCGAISKKRKKLYNTREIARKFLGF